VSEVLGLALEVLVRQEKTIMPKVWEVVVVELA
jgi:hypothetical protein